MLSLVDLTQRLSAKLNLRAEQVADAAAALASPDVSETEKADFLTALAIKGETAEEIAEFARAFRSRAIDPGVQRWAPDAIDIVGTGGDHAGGFNISSLVVLVLASAGVTAMKHGNRGITSRCGSADLLAALGVVIDAPPEKQRAALEHLGYAFFFAPAYHPTFKHIGPVRKALAARGQRTVFNILGPLINPGRPGHVLLGVFASAWVPKLASALDVLGATSGLAVHGVIDATRGIDELTTATPNDVRGFGRLRDISARWNAADFELGVAPFAELQGGDLAANVSIAEAVVAGRGPKGLVDTIALNAAVAMWIVGKTASVREGIAPARELLVGGAVAQKIRDTREFFAQ